jgi:tRNA(Ile)-lysidine synthetase-like protein
LINKKDPLVQKNFNLYLNKKFTGKEKILISASCGVDSTVLFYLIKKSNFFLNKNIFFIFFDHQKRAEGKFEIQNFIDYYKIKKKQYFIKKITSKLFDKSFQKKSRSSRLLNIKLLAKRINAHHIFLGHHLDDLYETFFLRDIQQSNIYGLQNIFSSFIKGLNIHRPLVEYQKKQILNFAIKNKIFWSEDRTNFELDYTRNKIRKFLTNNTNLKKLVIKRNNYLNIKKLFFVHNRYFKKINSRRYEIKFQDFNNLNNTLKAFVINSFYYDLRHSLKKPIRKENVMNIIYVLKNNEGFYNESPIFGGKISRYKEKICLNLK